MLTDWFFLEMIEQPITLQISRTERVWKTTQQQTKEKWKQKMLTSKYVEMINDSKKNFNLVICLN